MGFSQPLILIALVAAPLVALGLWYAATRRGRAAVRFAAADMLGDLVPKTARWRRVLPSALLVAAVVFGVVAAAGPTWTAKVPREQATLMLALDVSYSMMAEDVDPTRFVAAQEAASEAIDKLPGEMRAGVVAFAATAQVVEPPTREHDTAVSAIDALQLQPGTAVGDGIMASLDALGDGDAPAPADRTAAILLMSDGQTETGVDPAYAAQQARAAGVPVYTVAFGTDDGYVEIQGERIPVQVDEAELKQIAETTGGKSFRALDGESLAKIFDEVGSRVGLEERTFDLGGWAAAIAVAFLLLALVLSLIWFGRLV